MWNSSSTGPRTRRVPVPVTTSYSRQVSWKPPYRNDMDSTERYALELRHDLRQQPVRERAAYHLGECRSRLRGARARFDIDVQHGIQG